MIENKIKIDNEIDALKGKQLRLEKADVQFTRMYFSTKNERIGRSILLFSQVIMLVVLTIDIASLSAFVASKLPIHEMINAFGIADGLYRSMLISISAVGIVATFGFIIPLLTARTAQAVKMIGNVMIWVEVPIGIILLIASLLSAIYGPVEFNWIGVALAVVNIALLMIGSIYMISASNSLVKKINKAIDDSNKLDENYLVGLKG